MMVREPHSDLRRIRDEALESITGHTLADEYERGAIEMSWQRVTGEGASNLLPDTLRVELRSEERVGARAFALVSDGVQNAAARLARWRTHPEIDPAQKLSKVDTDRARLIQDVQVGNVIFYRLEAPASDGFDVSPMRTVAQESMRDLLEILPEGEDDDRAVDGILGSDVATRLAVHSISQAAVAAEDGLGLTFEAGEQSVRSVLTKDRATALSEELSRPVEQEYPDRLRGTMDGMRGTRHVFYLVLDDGSEIAGAATNKLLQDVKANIGNRVVADVVVTQRTSASGRPGRKAYRLVKVTPEVTLFE